MFDHHSIKPYDVNLHVLGVCFTYQLEIYIHTTVDLGSPCHTKLRFHCFDTELFYFLERHEIAKRNYYFLVKRAYNSLLTLSAV